MADKQTSRADKAGNAIDYALVYQGEPEKENEDYMKRERKAQPRRIASDTASRYYYDGPINKKRSKKITRKRVSGK
jgi:hypothetical protein